ncbi:MAG: patatin-like phospholipase family protein [Gammaproteobacteria bacterium]
MVKNQVTKVGLVLPGGGARGAYQAGVLKAVSDMLPADHGNPFPVVTGTSAGAINAAVVANNAMNFHQGIEDLVNVWGNFRCAQVYKSDAAYVAKMGAKWLAALTLGGLGPRNPHFLLNNAPLRDLLDSHLSFDRVRQAIDAGVLDALAITASGYSQAKALSFYMGSRDKAWQRARRAGVHTDIDLDHLMASVAVPFVFPPVKIGEEYFGDGALREAAPLSPAIHLGANRLLVIGTRDEQTMDQPNPSVFDGHPPSFGHIAGYILDTIFLDGLYADLERLTRINRLVEAGAETNFSVVDMHIIVPSKDIREIANRHKEQFPRPVKTLMRGIGAYNSGGRPLISYLLFEKTYCQELIDLGYHDAMLRKDRLLPFLLGDDVPALDGPKHIREALV